VAEGFVGAAVDAGVAAVIGREGAVCTRGRECSAKGDGAVVVAGTLMVREGGAEDAGFRAEVKVEAEAAAVEVTTKIEAVDEAGAAEGAASAPDGAAGAIEGTGGAGGAVGAPDDAVCAAEGAGDAGGAAGAPDDAAAAVVVAESAAGVVEGTAGAAGVPTSAVGAVGVPEVTAGVVIGWVVARSCVLRLEVVAVAIFLRVGVVPALSPSELLLLTKIRNKLHTTDFSDAVRCDREQPFS
jgi:hypothetical protein